jgi:hypothetical protein
MTKVTLENHCPILTGFEPAKAALETKFYHARQEQKHESYKSEDRKNY